MQVALVCPHGNWLVLRMLPKAGATAFSFQNWMRHFGPQGYETFQYYKGDLVGSLNLCPLLL